MAGFLALLLATGVFAAEPETDQPADTAAEEGGWWSEVERIWGYHLFSVGEHDIQTSQLVLAAGVLVLGILISRLLTRWVRGHLFARVGMNPNSAYIIEKFMFYLLVLLVLVGALQVMEIPITVFAFLGGALAIGIGFGAQNIINNFISGIILIFEQSIRVGDLVEVADHKGRVEEVRFRCTRVRRTDGVDVLVPNSQFLEKDVINWTLSDKKIRTNVAVGVAYGSDTEMTRKLVQRAVEEHGRVLAKPKPVIIFEDFADSALVFRVYFWSRVTTILDLEIIRSDLRYRIDKLFREADVVIAFPQRDVHLDTTEPLELRLARGGGREKEPTGQPPSGRRPAPAEGDEEDVTKSPTPKLPADVPRQDEEGG